MVKLNSQTLSDLPANIAVPTYDRSALTAGIVHIGLGNFQRAHQAWYLHRLMQNGQALDCVPTMKPVVWNCWNRTI